MQKYVEFLQAHLKLGEVAQDAQNRAVGADIGVQAEVGLQDDPCGCRG